MFYVFEIRNNRCKIQSNALERFKACALGWNLQSTIERNEENVKTLKTYTAVYSRSYNTLAQRNGDCSFPKSCAEHSPSFLNLTEKEWTGSLEQAFFF